MIEMFNDYLSRDKPNLIVMIGISGSGKSTVSKEIQKNNKENMEVLSSDDIREELFNDINDQKHNEQVFNTLKSRAYTYCSDGKNVIVDATNLSIKDRTWVFNSWKKDVDVYKIACIVPTSFWLCKLQNESRDRVVPEYVLDRQIRKFEIPFYEEGWDKIAIWNINDDMVKEENYRLNNIMYSDRLVEEMQGFDQKNCHHQYDLGTHCFKCYQELLKVTDNVHILRAGQIHDCGKRFVQAPRENNPNYSYLQHHNYGAYYALSNWDKIGIRQWMNINTVDDLLDVIFYINYHMIPFVIQKEKTFDKYKRIFGEEKFNNLMMFNKCDKIASGTKDI